MMYRNHGSPAATETVLVIDEDAQGRRSLEEAVSGRGYRVVAARGGAEAVVAAARARPAATLLDIGVRGGEGIETLRALKSAGHGGLIIVVTANGTLRTAREAMILGAHDYVTRPFQPWLLHLLLREGLGERMEVAACAP
jgi:two-component system response regulator MprA